jgi:hypothetical protein
MRQIISSLFILVFLASYLDTALVLNLLGRSSQSGCLPGGGCCCVGADGKGTCTMEHNKPQPVTGSRGACSVATAGCHPVAMVLIPQIEKDFFPRVGVVSNGVERSSTTYVIASRNSYTLILAGSIFHPPNASFLLFIS